MIDEKKIAKAKVDDIVTYLYADIRKNSYWVNRWFDYKIEKKKRDHRIAKAIKLVRKHEKRNCFHKLEKFKPMSRSTARRLQKVIADGLEQMKMIRYEQAT